MLTISRRASLALCLSLLFPASLLATGCSRKADAATVESIKSAYARESTAFGMRNAAGVLACYHPKYEDETDDSFISRPNYDEMLQELLARTQSCSISSDVIEARLLGDNTCRVTVSRQINANVYNPEDRQMHQVSQQEMCRDVWERDAAKDWLKRSSRVTSPRPTSGVVVVGIHGAVRPRSGGGGAPRIRFRRRF